LELVALSVVLLPTTTQNRSETGQGNEAIPAQRLLLAHGLTLGLCSRDLAENTPRAAAKLLGRQSTHLDRNAIYQSSITIT
jgi:hypothetical protein